MSPARERVSRLLDQVRAEYAPDPRLAVFEVEADVDGDALVLAGATSEPAAAEALHRGAASLGAWSVVRDEVARLPAGDRAEAAHAVVTSAIAPMQAAPAVNTTQVSQVVLGDHVTVLRRRGRWLQCRARDGYLGWIHCGYAALLDETDAVAWEMGTRGEAWISLGAELRDEAGETFARLPWGARVVREAPDRVRLPDGRRGRPAGELVPAAERPLRFPLRGEAVVATAGRWVGAPYLWGGITPAGVDCSGLVQAAYRLHGHLLPRDSDMQSRVGDEVDPGGFDAFLPGDLLFFAEDPGRCTHVVMSEGGSRIIHSSLGNGGVARNDLLGTHNYERELRRIFLCARRIVGGAG